MTKIVIAAGDIFVRLANDGDKVVGAFLGDPLAREVHWNGERYEECPGPESKCSHCAESKRPSLRVSIVITPECLMAWQAFRNRFMKASLSNAG